MRQDATKLVYVVCGEEITRAHIPSVDYAEAIQEPGVCTTFAQAKREAREQVEMAMSDHRHRLDRLRDLRVRDTDETWTDNVGVLLGY
jgi:hypothetical protein